MELPISKKTVELKKFFTGDDWEYIQEALADNVIVEQSRSKVTSGALRKYNTAKLTRGVIKLGDKTENLVDELLHLPLDDYQLILDELDKMLPTGKVMPN